MLWISSLSLQWLLLLLNCSWSLLKNCLLLLLRCICSICTLDCANYTARIIYYFIWYCWRWLFINFRALLPYFIDTTSLYRLGRLSLRLLLRRLRSWLFPRLEHLKKVLNNKVVWVLGLSLNWIFFLSIVQNVP